jgi:hypothetical protein
MTLNLLLASPHGLWLSSDHRVTDRRNGSWIPREDYWSPKHFTLRAYDSACLAMTYTGLAEVDSTKGRLPVSEWLAHILHGKPRTLADALQHIAAEASATREMRMLHHIFTGVASTVDGVQAVQISNVDIRAGEGGSSPNWQRRQPKRSFDVRTRHVRTDAQAVGGALGSGAAALTDEERAKLERLCRLKPRHPDEYMDVLSSINAAVAKRDRTVSPACEVAYLDPDLTKGSRSHGFRNGQTPPDGYKAKMIFNLGGIDLTEPHPFLQEVQARWDRLRAEGLMDPPEDEQTIRYRTRHARRRRSTG